MPSARQMLLHSWAGRLFIVAAAVKMLVSVLRSVATVPGAIEVLSSAATLGLVVAVGSFIWRLFVLTQRRLLWRVRRKLILSYIFIGVVPALLIIAFFTLGAWVVSTNVSSYLFREGYEDVVNDATRAATAAALEIARNPRTAAETVDRVHRNISRVYRACALEFLPSSPAGPPPVRAGAWSHLSTPPDAVPSWVTAAGFSGSIADAEGGGDGSLIIRSVVPVTTEKAPIGFVIVDIPVDAELLSGLHESTGVKAEAMHPAAARSGRLTPTGYAHRRQGRRLPVRQGHHHARFARVAHGGRCAAPPSPTRMRSATSTRSCRAPSR